MGRFPPKVTVGFFKKSITRMHGLMATHALHNPQSIASLWSEIPLERHHQKPILSPPIHLVPPTHVSFRSQTLHCCHCTTSCSLSRTLSVWIQDQSQPSFSILNSVRWETELPPSNSWFLATVKACQHHQETNQLVCRRNQSVSI